MERESAKSIAATWAQALSDGNTATSKVAQLCLPLALEGIRFEKHPCLPCHRDAALLIPKIEGAKREFWLSDNGEVWGFSELVNSTARIYLTEQMFDQLKARIEGANDETD